MKFSFHSLIPSLPFLLTHLRLPSPELDQILDNNSTQTKSSSTELSELLTTNSNNLHRPFITPRHRLRKKTASLLLRRLVLILRLTMDVLLLRAYVSTGMCLPSHCLAMGICVTLLNCISVSDELRSPTVILLALWYCSDVKITLREMSDTSNEIPATVYIQNAEKGIQSDYRCCMLS
jgi:hypothetical protein